MTPNYFNGPAARHAYEATYARMARTLSHGTEEARRLLETAGSKVRAAGWTMAGTANLLTLFLFACYLELAVFGVFALAFAGLLLLSRAQSALLMQTHGDMQVVSRDRGRFDSELALHAVSCLVLCVMLAAFGWLVSMYSRPAGHLLIALALTAVPWLGQVFVRRALHALGELRAAAICDGVTYGLQLFGALVLVTSAAAWATPVSALSVLALSSATGLTTGCWLLRKRGSPHEPARAR